MRDKNKSKEELQAIREAQKRIAWISKVKRTNGYSQEEAEKAWAKTYNS